jgi:hypothetical protein
VKKFSHPTWVIRDFARVDREEERKHERGEYLGNDEGCNGGEGNVAGELRDRHPK